MWEKRESSIFWDDLKPEVKEGMARDRGVTPEQLSKEMDFDVIPIAVFEF